MGILNELCWHTGLTLILSGLHPFIREDVFIWKAIKYVMIGFVTSALSLLLYCCYKDVLLGDFWDITRQICLVNPFQLIVVTHCILKLKKKQIQRLFLEIEKAYENVDRIEEKYRPIMKSCFEEFVSHERVWIIQSFATVFSFPGQAIIIMIYFYINDLSSSRRMIHELKLPFFDDMKYQSPIYEVVFLYELGVCYLAYVSFASWNPMILMLISYAKHQLKLIKAKLNNLFEDVDEDDYEEIQNRLGQIIQRHHYAIAYFEQIQDIFQPFFSNLIILTSLQICVTSIQVIEALETKSLSAEFVIFSISSSFQIYILCQAGTEFAEASLDVADAAYECGWENVPDSRIRHDLKFVIMRAQKLLLFSALGITPINMIAFGGIINNAWSFVTLLRSSK